MKVKLIILVFVVLGIASCTTKKQSAEQKAVDVAKLLTMADNHFDQQVLIKGTVNHVCTHSGRRCFLIDSTGEHSIRVEAAGQIENFPKEIMGSEILVKGTLKEQCLTAEEIDQMEADLLEKHPEESEKNGENCSAEMSNIHQMRNWMKEHGKDYYAIYYVEGHSYEAIQ